MKILEKRQQQQKKKKQNKTKLSFLYGKKIYVNINL